MSYGIIDYNADGKPKCEICGNYYHRVLTHVRQKHLMTERDYKIMFGFDLRKGITSLESKIKSQEAVMNNYDTVVTDNLLKKGAGNRFQDEHKGRTKEMVSEQTRLMLKERLKSPAMQKAMIQNGRKVGLSGKGNAIRWNNTLEVTP